MFTWPWTDWLLCGLAEPWIDLLLCGPARPSLLCCCVAERGLLFVRSLLTEQPKPFPSLLMTMRVELLSRRQSVYDSITL